MPVCVMNSETPAPIGMENFDSTDPTRDIRFSLIAILLIRPGLKNFFYVIDRRVHRLPGRYSGSVFKGGGFSPGTLNMGCRPLVQLA